MLEFPVIPESSERSRNKTRFARIILISYMAQIAGPGTNVIHFQYIIFTNHDNFLRVYLTLL